MLYYIVLYYIIVYLYYIIDKDRHGLVAVRTLFFPRVGASWRGCMVQLRGTQRAGLAACQEPCCSSKHMKRTEIYDTDVNMSQFYLNMLFI